MLVDRCSWLGLAVAAVTLLTFAPRSADAEIKGLEIIAPATPGGGWDQTARSMQAALQSAGLASGVQVKNVSGAGGTIGLAQFVTRTKGRGSSLLVSGLIMVGAILTNKSPVTLDEVTPIARLTGEHEVVVVPAASPIKTMADLTAKLKQDPGSVSWAGGSTGGTDHMLVGLIAKAADVNPTRINYIAHSGGGEALSSLLGGHVTAGVSGLAEFLPQIVAGTLRPLAISADARLPGLDVPTLKEQGLDVTLINWRGVLAPPKLKDADKKALSDLIGAMVASKAWKDILAKRGWIDMYQPADEFAAFLAKDRAQVESILKEIGLVK
jgi:putative tricarboxylic transport membrane protein